jgi:hypothetical protein
MRKNILLYGFIAGVIISTFMAISMAVMGCSAGDPKSKMTSMIIGFAAMVASFSFVFIGIKNFRDKQNDGVIKFGKAFLIGSLISLVASTMYVLTWGVEFHFFMPDFMDKYSEMQIQDLHKSGVKGDLLNLGIKKIEETRDNYKSNPLFFAAYSYIEILPVGIIVSLISALILKRKKKVTLV